MRKHRTIGIYCIQTLVNNKVYIGQSVCIENRWSQHLNSLKNGNNDNRYLQEDWNEYGESSFSFRILEECAKEELDEKESFYISQFHSSLIYNLTDGGRVGFKHSPELLKLESDIQKKKYEDNPELREQRRVDALKQWSNPEIKAKIMGEGNGMYGRTHTPEVREKIARAQRGRISWKRTWIPVLCVELNKVYPSGADACKDLDIKNASNIYDVCKGIRKTCGGYTWKYAK